MRRIAALARLALTTEEVGALGGELASVLAAFEDLTRAQVDGIAPLISPADGGPGTTAGPREDRLAPGIERRELLARAPATDAPTDAPADAPADSVARAEPRYFKVPPAIAQRDPGPSDGGAP